MASTVVGARRRLDARRKLHEATNSSYSCPMHSVVDLERGLVRFTRTARSAGMRAADVLSPGLEQSGYALIVVIERLGHAHACELADVIGLDKSTVSRLLASLAHREL